MGTKGKKGMAELRVVVETAGVRAPVGAHGGVRHRRRRRGRARRGQAGHLAEAIGAQAETGGAGTGAAVAEPTVVAAATDCRDRRHASRRGRGGDRGEARRGASADVGGDASLEEDSAARAARRAANVAADAVMTPTPTVRARRV